MSERLTDEQIEQARILLSQWHIENDEQYYGLSIDQVRGVLWEFENMLDIVSNTQQENASLLQVVEEKNKALEFYADEATYDIEHLNRHGYIIIDKDGGAIARKALGKE